MHAPRASLDALTGIRFVAAVAVVFHHFGQAHVPAGHLRSLALGGFVGVDLFFLLSGFVLAYVYRPSSRIDVRSFLAARFARVFPLYLLGLALAAPTYFADLCQRHTPIDAAMRALASTAMHLTMTHAWVGHSGVWNVPDWSLSCEWAFYLAFAFIAPPLFRVRRPLAVATGLWVGGEVVAFGYHLLHPQLVGGAASATTFVGGLLEYSPLPRLHEFAIGIVLGRVWLEEAKWRSGTSSAWLSVGASLVALAVLAQSPGLPLLPLSNGLLAPVFAALIVALATGRGVVARFLASPPMRALGDASYGLYILHWPLWTTSRPLRLALERASPGLAFWTYLALTIAASLAAYRWVERPLRGALRRWLERPPATPAPINGGMSS